MAVQRKPRLGNASRQQSSDHAPSDVEVNAGEMAGSAHDLGPWIPTPSSSRVSAFRFDHLQRELQVTWRNQKGPGHIYENIDYEAYRAFARVASKGKHINSTLNNYVYRRILPNELDAPSNEKRKGIGSRLRT